MYFKAINYINKYINYIKNWILKFYYFIFLYSLNSVSNYTLFAIDNRRGSILLIYREAIIN